MGRWAWPVIGFVLIYTAVIMLALSLPAPFHGSDKVLGYGAIPAGLWYFGALFWRLRRGHRTGRPSLRAIAMAHHRRSGGARWAIAGLRSLGDTAPILPWVAGAMLAALTLIGAVLLIVVPVRARRALSDREAALSLPGPTSRPTDMQRLDTEKGDRHE